MDILNKKSEIKEALIRKINSANEIYIAVSFITIDAWNYLVNNSDILSKKINIITTTENFITDPYVLKYFMDKKIEVTLVNKSKDTRSFHSKFITFKNKNDVETMVGSMNLTSNAFFNKFENVTFVNSNKYLEYYEFLKNVGESLTEEYVMEYSEIYLSYTARYNEFVEDLRKKVNLKPNEMQSNVLKELEIVRSSGKNKALLWSATGTGKTYLSAFDAKKNGFKKLLFIVHNRTIIKSAKRDFENVFFDKTAIELHTWNRKLISDSEMVFTTEKTVTSLIKTNPNFLEKFDYVIFDEAHKLGPENNQGKIFNMIKDRPEIFILGMTATPNRSDDPSYLIDSFKEVVGKIDTKEAIKLGLICKFNYYGTDVPVDFNDEKLSNNDLDLMIEKFVFELKKHNVWDGKKIKGIVFVKNIIESEYVAQKLTEVGYKSYPIHSKSNLNGDLIGDYIDNLQNENSNLNFLVTINKFNEGVDIPAINTIGMFRFTESNIIYTQQIGRGLRIDKDKKKKLNIIDLVGNHDNNFERIIGLNGSTLMNPKEVLERVMNNDINKNETLIDFNITKIARDKILNSLGSISYNRYFKEKLFELHKIYGKDIKLSDLELELDETIQVISNNLRPKATCNNGDKSWITIAYESMGKDLDGISDTENQIIELFGWMPITVSTPKEKVEILKLMNGEEANLDNKWKSYFAGKNIKNNSMSQLVKGDFSEFFEFSNNIKFNSPLRSKHSLFLFKEIRNYLELNLIRDDKLIGDSWYSKAEIGFTAGFTSNVVKGKFRKYIDEKTFESNEYFLTNTVNKKGGTPYKNEVLERDEFIVSNDGMKLFDDPLKVHNFLGNDLFNNGVLYKYVGKPLSMEEHDVEMTNDINDPVYKIKEYQRYSLLTDTKLNNRDFHYFKFSK